MNFNNPAAVISLDYSALLGEAWNCVPDRLPLLQMQMDEVISAIRELLAADREYDERLKDFNNTSATLDYWPHVYSRWQESVKRRAAALARFES